MVKITFILMLAASMQISATGIAQTVTLSVKNVPLKTVFKTIRQQTGYNFIYNEAWLSRSHPVTLHVTNSPLLPILDSCFKGQPFTYTIIQKTIALKRKEQLKREDTLITVHGRVINEKGEPVPGVSIRVKDTTFGTLTDGDGNFVLNGIYKNATLVFSSVGYERKEIKLNGQKVVNIQLEASVSKLGGVNVVVSTGYQKIPKDRATGSFEKLDQKTLETKTSQNIISKIEGEIPGIVFNTGGESMTIRGTSTINAEKAPLIVVDGFPLTQDINSINPNNVKSITVLKDAAAASIWGIRAANGVIVITTKTGRKNRKPAIEFSANFSTKPKQDYDKLPYASTESFLEFEKIRAGNTGWGVQLPTALSKPPLSKALETYLLLNNGDITQTEADAITNKLKNIDNRDEFDRLFRKDEYWQQYNLAVSGGGKSNTYRTSITYNRNTNRGSYIGNTRDEIMGTLSNKIDIIPKLEFTGNANFNFISGKSNGMSFSNLQTLPQYQQILDKDGNYITEPATFTQSYKEELVASGYPYNWDYNLKQEFDNKNNRYNQTLLRLQTALKYKIIDGLSVSGMYQYEWAKYDQNNLYNENTYLVRSTVNRYTVADASGNLTSSIPEGYIFAKSNSTRKSHSARFQLNFDKAFNQGLHKVTAIGGYEVRQELSDGSNFTHYGYDPQSLQYIDVPFGEQLPVVPYGTSVFGNPSRYSEVENRYISYYGNAAYTYNNKYTFSASTRLDDANLFGGSKKYRNIPLYSFGAKWDIYKENFLENFDDLSQLSLRVTRGSNGNVDLSTSPFVQASTSKNPFTNVPFAYISNVKNPELRLEKTFVTNVGLDFGFFNNRINGSVEYYKRSSKDLLAPIMFNSTLGFTEALVNSGKMENKGWDVNLNALVVDGKDFKYNTSLNFSYNKNTVTKVDNPQETTAYYMSGLSPIKGNPLHYMYSYKFAGLDEEGYPQYYNENNEIINSEGKKSDKEGNWVDASIEDIDALDYHGTTVPKYYGGWINNFIYKGFSLRVLATYKLGYVFRNTNILDYASMVSYYAASHIHKDFDKRWRQPGDENTTIIPREPENVSTQYIGYYYYKQGNQFVDIASHIRLKEIILGYNLNPGISRRLGVGRLNISVQANNLGVITFNKWHIDPESMVLPMQSTFILSLKANF